MTILTTDSIQKAFAGMMGSPRPLLNAIQFYHTGRTVSVLALEQALTRRVSAGTADPVGVLVQNSLRRWDWEEAARWAKRTRPNTRERRILLYGLLQVRPPLQAILDKHVPYYRAPSSHLIAATDPSASWYTSDRRASHQFYFSRLREYLPEVRHLTQDAVNALDAATTKIMRRLGDPTAANPRAARGLVVGYVQSGKTTNFTALIAKAIDAGYRLVIVLTGTTNLLRNQTQRRLDMELVGVENILRGAVEGEADHDYNHDDAWPDRFTKYGVLPSHFGQPDILRVTGREDIGPVRAGVNPLDFEQDKADRNRPLHDAVNLSHAGARLVVVKKVKSRLTRLLRHLEIAGKAVCSEVSALIIDDEADQASLNTVNPRTAASNRKSASEEEKRNTINRLIVKLLQQLPRAQYIGYTATPYANVFVNPSDPVDLYPRDFLLSLDRPMEYMGAREFMDLGLDNLKAHRLTNRDAYVREVPRPDRLTDDRILEALDAFVLTGAIKKYRSHRNSEVFKHHTMLFNCSERVEDHLDLKRRIQRVWKGAGYDTPGASQERLATLLNGDLRKVWLDRGRTLGYSFPASLSGLRKYVGHALDEIRNGDPILIVNASEDGEVPDFERKAGIWKIIVGGNKLSRGYTVEGLTISYFRRRARVQDTLMQMSRWFGYRQGYRDLVRLYVGTREPDSQIGILNLYEAFESVCRDEEAFRDQLTLYEESSDGQRPLVTPAQVPALVFNSHPALRPAARNKMFNAALTWVGFTYREPTTQAASGAGRKRNAERVRSLLSRKVLQNGTARKVGTTEQFKFKWTEAAHKEVVDLLGAFEWADGESAIGGELRFLNRREARVRRWLIVAPQLQSAALTWTIKKGIGLTCISRTRVSKKRFGIYSDPLHVAFGKWLVGVKGDVYKGSTLKPNTETGVLLLYPTVERGLVRMADDHPVMGFALQLPHNPEARRVAFSVVDGKHPNEITIGILRNR